MRIAMMGTRGVPAAYGGFETAVEEIGTRLAEAGNEVIVYCRGRTGGPHTYKGMRTVDLPAVKRREAETLSHTAISAVHAVARARPDVAFVFNAANSPLLPILRAARIPVALHTDGLEWKRGKWGPAGQKYYLMAEALGVFLADRLISDAEGIADYYRTRYGATSTVLRYGGNLLYASPNLIEGFGLLPAGYHLVVARLEPENHVDVILRGYLASKARLPLAVVGSVPYPTDHSRDIERLGADPRIRLLGGVWDQNLLDALYANSASYLHGHSVGGTNPSLLRAMGAGAPVSAYDVSFNREVLGDTGDVYWRNDDEVARILVDVEAEPRIWRKRGDEAQKRVAAVYDWDAVASGYARLAEELRVAGPSRQHRGLRGLRRLVGRAQDAEAGAGPWSA